MADKEQHAISPTRSENYPEWYQQVITAAELAENAVVRGCMVIRPWGYGIWEQLQRSLDEKIKETGHENAYFPLFIPLSFLEKEATHVEGFAKECAVVTHHRLEARDGKLVPSGELEEPLVIRPTSETIIGDSFSKWVQSYRDLPLLINQWANVVRWEMRTRIFLRTSEFLWQEGHTAHATAAEAQEEVTRMLNVYADLCEQVLAMPVIRGRKSPGERFPGAEDSFCVEAMMQDRKVLQAGTSHFLGQNFAKASNIKFLNQAGELEYAYTTSWGVSTRLIGGLIMTHADDDGMRVPPRVAPKHVVILPVFPNEECKESVLAYAKELQGMLAALRYEDEKLRVQLDTRDIRGGEKSWQWIKKGVPIRIEVGPRDVENKKFVLMRRDKGPKEKEFLAREDIARVPGILAEVQSNYFTQARAFRDAHIREGIESFDELKAYFTPKNEQQPEIHGGFARVKWAGSKEQEEQLHELKLKISCLPLEQSGTKGRCILTGKDATLDAIIAKSY